jgi:hypothetical protein
MAPQDPPKGEVGAELAEASFEQHLANVRREAEPLARRLAEELRLPEDDVRALAIVVLGRYLDMTAAEDTFVLVVRGTVTPYDTALQALVSGAPSGASIEALLSARTTDEAASS